VCGGVAVRGEAGWGISDWVVGLWGRIGGRTRRQAGAADSQEGKITERM
jgi:hypothetical protein